MSTKAEVEKDWSSLGYGPTTSKTPPVRWANRGPESPRKRSHSFRACDIVRAAPDLNDESMNSFGNKSSMTSFGNKSSATRSTAPALSDDHPDENSLADGFDDEDFVVFESDDEDETEYLPSESNVEEEDPADTTEARLQIKKLPATAVEQEEKKILWEKPDWTMKTNLKPTEKGEKLKQSGDIKEQKSIEWTKPEWTKLNGSLRKVNLDESDSSAWY